MRPLIACLFVFVSTAFFSLTANADLVSLYTFDNTANNSIATAPDGTLQGGTSYVSGKIGNAVSMDGDDGYVDLTTAGLPGGNGLWTGSVSFWIKTTCTGEAKIVAGFNNTGHTAFQLAANHKHNSPETGNWFLWMRADNSGGSFSADMRTPNQVWRDGNWHQVILAWNVTTGSSGTGSAQYYIDGSPVTTDVGYNSINSSKTFSPWIYPLRLGCNGHSQPGDIDDIFLDGSLDDVGVWSDRLTDVEAAALYNLASDSTLNYNSADTTLLFDTFAGGPGTEITTSDGRRWVYSSSIAGTPGSVINHSGVVLGDGGLGGVQLVPEPGTTVLFCMAGVAGLIVCAWRKRK